MSAISPKVESFFSPKNLTYPLSTQALFEKAIQKNPKEEDLRLFEKVLHRRKDVHIRQDQMLRFASLVGSEKVIKILLDAGANLHVLNDAPFHIAVCYERISVIKLLLDYGANVNSRNFEAIKVAFDRKNKVLLKLLQDYGADLSILII